MKRSLTALVMLACLGFAIGAPAPAGAKGAPRDLLPNLVPLPSETIRMGDTEPYPASLSQPSIAINGCRVDEMAEQNARRCLRFDTAVANFGQGPVELRYVTGPSSTDPNAPLTQRIYRSDGTFRERPASPSEFHPVHGHYHYKDFSISRLWRATSKGKRLGKSAIRSGKKNGFCFEDTAAVRQDTRPRYNCLDYEPGTEGIDRVTGISVGWKDVYTYTLNGQFIEITGVPDGYYLLTTTVDPDRTVAETTHSDNTRSQLIQICGYTATIVAPGPPVAC